MDKKTINFIATWVVFTGILFGVHFYILYNLTPKFEFFFPLWSIYLFNSLLAFIIYFLVKRQFSKDFTKTYQTFLILTTIKMFLAIVFLLPLFTGKSSHPAIETTNFFIPYFLFLAFEIFNLNKYFQNQKTK